MLKEETDMRIKISNLIHSFEYGRVILDDISFDEDISTMAFIDLSGGGKSTLLRILAGLINPVSG